MLLNPHRFAAAGGTPGTKKFLAHFDGANGSSTFVDEMGHVLTQYASPTISTSQSKFGGSSFSSDRTKGLYTGYESDFTLSGEWTIDFWWRPSSVSGNFQAPVLLLADDLSQAIQFLHQASTAFSVTINRPDTSVGLDALSVFTANVWRHIEFGQDAAGTLRLFVNGVLQNSVSTPGGAFTKPLKLCIGYAVDLAGDGYGFSGHMDELCIRTGFSHTASFTPPAVPYS